MQKPIIIILAIFAALAAAAHFHFGDRGRFTTPAEFDGLERLLTDEGLLSETDPSVLLQFDPSYQHLGGQKFVLYGVADTEQHFFVETTPDNKVQSLYWVQFEAYTPDNNYTYDYDDSPLRLQLGDFDFYTDTDAVQVDPDRKRRRGTDGTLARTFVESKGYSFPANYSYSRLVHLTDETRRKELMIIFIDSLAPQNLTGSELQEGGSAADQWATVEANHLDKIRRTMTLTAPAE